MPDRPDLNQPGVMRAVRDCGGKKAWDGSAIDRPILIVDFSEGTSALMIPRLEGRLSQLLDVDVEVISAAVADTGIWQRARDLDPDE